MVCTNSRGVFNDASAPQVMSAWALARRRAMIGSARPIATPRMRVLRSSATMVESFLINVAKERLMHLRFVPGAAGDPQGRLGSTVQRSADFPTACLPLKYPTPSEMSSRAGEA